MDIKAITAWADAHFDETAAVRRLLHAHPELSGREHATQAYLFKQLAAADISCRASAGTGVVAWVTGRPGGRAVAARADIDALALRELSDAPYASQNSGVMHACGHDAHTAIQLACCRFFGEHRNDFCGTVKFFFQPAEETVGGAAQMLAEGYLRDPDVTSAVALHVTPALAYNEIELRDGAFNACCDSVTLTVTGKSAHGAYPERGLDAVVVAAQMVTALQTVVSRTVSPLDSAVLTFGTIHGGEAGNILCDEVRLTGTLRTVDSQTRERVLMRLTALAQGVARGMGGDCAVALGDSYPLLYNDKGVNRIIEASAADILGRGNIFQKEQPGMGGDDFALFCANTRAAMYNLGCRVPGRPPYALHTRDFDIDERCLITGVALQCAILTRLLAEQAS